MVLVKGALHVCTTQKKRTQPVLSHGQHMGANARAFSAVEHLSDVVAASASMPVKVNVHTRPKGDTSQAVFQPLLDAIDSSSTVCAAD